MRIRLEAHLPIAAGARVAQRRHQTASEGIRRHQKASGSKHTFVEHQVHVLHGSWPYGPPPRAEGLCAKHAASQSSQRSWYRGSSREIAGDSHGRLCEIVGDGARSPPSAPAYVPSYGRCPTARPARRSRRPPHGSPRGWCPPPAAACTWEHGTFLAIILGRSWRSWDIVGARGSSWELVGARGRWAPASSRSYNFAVGEASKQLEAIRGNQ